MFVRHSDHKKKSYQACLHQYSFLYIKTFRKQFSFTERCSNVIFSDFEQVFAGWVKVGKPSMKE